jgi:hypothetical protein
MKTLSLILLILLSLSFVVTAEEQEDKPWDFFGVVFVPGIPSSSDDTNISGIRVGVPIAGGLNEVRGIEVGAACCWTKDVKGIQTAPLFCVAETLSGVQASPVTVADKVSGMQFGLLNISKEATIQLGFFNYMRDGFIPFMIIMNVKF